MRALAAFAFSLFPLLLAGCEDCKGPEPMAPVDAAADANAASADAADASPALPPRTAPRTDIPKTTGAPEAGPAAVTGDVDELVQALARTDAMIAADARIAIHVITRTRLLLALGRVEDASQAFVLARKKGATARELDPVEVDLDWGQGHASVAADAARRLAKESPTVATLTRCARIEHLMGDDVASDRLFDAAEDRATIDAAALADIYTWRGFAKLDLGKPEEARAWFEAALTRLPASTRATRGLAEALDRLGDTKGAITKLEAAGDKDPDLLALLARLSPPARAKAKARFTELLARTPEAVLASAAGFYLDAGEPKRAAELAARAVRESPTPANHLLLARAQLASGDVPAARNAIDAALRSPVVSARADWTAARIYGRLGQPGKAGELEARARRRDPRIESTEPPLKK